ncbi:MAG TPA: NAD-dependent epimerase/dehydratase family protein [Cyclobacteriaceae bacterium]|nr:NAD-dependent epimerase/dehydratase family protein [Cyclobacteriaceae bacterium]
MKIFITGATGFIGKRLLDLLSKTKHELHCLVRKSNPSGEKLRASGINVIEGDVRDKASIFQGMRGCDSVIHLANVYSYWEPDNSIYRATNVDGTRNIMESVLETKVSKVIHVSSVVTYGKPSEIPFKEESKPGPVRFSRYAQTKFEGDKIVWDLYKNKGLPVVVVYPGAVLGAGDPKASGQYVNGLINKRLPATVFNNSILTWVYVKDVAEGIIKALEKLDNIGGKYLLGKYQISVKDFNEIIHKISGVSLPRISMPDFLAFANAHILTGIANLIKQPPLWGMAVDQMKTMKEGFMADGSKAERELGLSYTPIEIALEEHIEAARKKK